MKYKLGEVVEHNGDRWMVTAVYPHGYYVPGLGFSILTPIPPGMEPEDLGRKFKSAYLDGEPHMPNERMEVWPAE